MILHLFYWVIWMKIIYFWGILPIDKLIGLNLEFYVFEVQILTIALKKLSF